jgi:hypothetical protein
MAAVGSVFPVLPIIPADMIFRTAVFPNAADILGNTSFMGDLVIPDEVLGDGVSAEEGTGVLARAGRGAGLVLREGAGTSDSGACLPAAIRGASGIGVGGPYPLGTGDGGSFGSRRL